MSRGSVSDRLRWKVAKVKFYTVWGLWLASQSGIAADVIITFMV